LFVGITDLEGANMASELDLGAQTAVDARPRTGSDWLARGGPIVLAIALVSLAARIAVPLPGTLVPITLQDLTVLAVGIVLGPRRGALAIASYVILGAMGAPVFSAGRSGIAWLMGPTGGYLLAFPVSAAVIGWAAQTRRMLPFVAGLAAAHLVTFTGGVMQLALVTGTGVGAAVATGFLPFLPGIAIKSVLLIAFFTGWTRWRAPEKSAPEA
jgi:biotin transport system substrate-specific component